MLFRFSFICVSVWYSLINILILLWRKVSSLFLPRILEWNSKFAKTCLNNGSENKASTIDSLSMPELDSNSWIVLLVLIISSHFSLFDWTSISSIFFVNTGFGGASSLFLWYCFSFRTVLSLIIKSDTRRHSLSAACFAPILSRFRISSHIISKFSYVWYEISKLLVDNSTGLRVVFILSYVGLVVSLASEGRGDLHLHADASILVDLHWYVPRRNFALVVCPWLRFLSRVIFLIYYLLAIRAIASELDVVFADFGFIKILSGSEKNWLLLHEFAVHYLFKFGGSNQIRTD